MNYFDLLYINALHFMTSTSAYEDPLPYDDVSVSLSSVMFILPLPEIFKGASSSLK